MLQSGSRESSRLQEWNQPFFYPFPMSRRHSVSHIESDSPQYLMMMQSIMSLHMTHPHSPPDAGAMRRGGHVLNPFNLMLL